MIAADSNANAQCVDNTRRYQQDSVNFIRVRYRASVPAWAKTVFRAGMNLWNSPVCNRLGSYGEGLDFREFPVFTETGGTQYDGLIYVNFVEGRYGPNPRVCGRLAGLDVYLYSTAVIDGEEVDCQTDGLFLDTISHELGHRLGLDHSDCPGHIMSQATIHNGQYLDRAIQPSECESIANAHLTPEDAVAEDGYCQQHDSSCHDGDYEYCSPIVIPLTPRTELAFTSPEEGVWFDLDGGGVDRVGWTRQGERLALLWRDLNKNLRVDSGRELFGSVTPLLSGGEALMGYEALAEFDAEEFGGNGNGWADVNDQYWSELLLWIDLNHDGVSQPKEILTPRQAGLYAIRVQANHGRKKDVYGNWPRWSAPAYIRKGRRSFVTQTVDVFFVHAPH